MEDEERPSIQYHMDIDYNFTAAILKKKIWKKK